MPNYNPCSPDKYPVAWVSLLQKCLSSPGVWIDVEAAHSDWQAVARMKRLRAFVKGFQVFPGVKPDMSAQLRDCHVRFRKVPWEFRWFRFSVQMQVELPRTDYAELAAKALEENSQVVAKDG